MSIRENSGSSRGFAGRRRRGQLSGVVAVVLALSLLGTRPAVGGDGASAAIDDAQWPVIEPANGALQLVAESYAADFGVSVPEALRRLTLRESLDPLLEDYATEFSDVYAGAVVHHEGGFWVEARFVGKVPDGATLPAVGLPVTLAGGAPASIQDRAEQVEDLVKEMPSGLAGAVIAPDMLTGRIGVAIETDSEMGVAEVTGLLPAALAAPNIDLSFVESAGNDDQVYGGAKTIYVPNGGHCTTGFSVTKGTTSGILTAGHCSNNNRNYQNPVTLAQTSMPYYTQYVGYYGDVQMHTTSLIEYDDFYYASTSLQDVGSVKSVGSFGYGDYVCRYGRSTGNDCYTLVAWNVSKFITTSQVWTYKLACGSADLASSGDSGGPWYSGSTAWGIHQGPAYVSGVLKDCFTPADYVDDAIGATVKTW